MVKGGKSVKSKTTTKSASKAQKAAAAKPVEVAPVEVKPVQEAAPVAEVATQVENKVSEVVDDQNIFEDIDNALAQISNIRSQCTATCALLRSIRSRHARAVKTALKQGKKRTSANRRPSGFTKPSLITDELVQFIKKVTKEDPGKMVARTQVTKIINQYIRDNKLQDPSYGRRILPDKELTTLLKLNKNDELTYFNLQTKISPHFPKNAEGKSITTLQ